MTRLKESDLDDWQRDFSRYGRISSAVWEYCPDEFGLLLAEIRLLRAENELLSTDRQLLMQAAQAFESAIAEIDQYGELDCYVTYQIAKEKMTEWRAMQSK